MRMTLLAVAAAVTSSFVINESPSAPAVPPGLVEHINAERRGWTASSTSSARFAKLTRAEVSRLMGSRKAPASVKARHSNWDLTALPTSALPTNFDVRTAFPWAANVTSVVRDQSACGSCWAFGSTEAFNDRLAIAANYSQLLSPADTAFCCTGMSQGCDGGYTDEAWQWFTSKGVVTGGLFESVGDGKSCYPYPFMTCAHHEPNPAHPNCPTNEYPTQACPAAKGCPNSGYPTAWKSDEHLAASSFNLQTVNAAMTDLVARGTVTASFQVYSDFLTVSAAEENARAPRLL